MIRSGSMPMSAAKPHPHACHSSCPGAWASVSIDTRHPHSSASAVSSSGGSRRSGRQLISTAVSNRAQAANTMSASKRDEGDPAR